jgi:two-component system, OmpR family, sensor histidine kinase KdpD
MATAIGVALDRTMSVAGIAMVYLLAIVPAALLLERFAGLLTSILSVSALNFFFVPPRYTFEVDGAEYWWTLAILLALSLALSSLIARLRDRQQRAETATRQSLQLHALTQALATTASPDAMCLLASGWFSQALSLPCAIYLRSSEGSLVRYTHQPGAAFEASAALWSIEHARALGRGSPDWPNLPLWCAPFAGRDPGGCVQLALDDGWTPGADLHAHWLALVQQAGLSIERAQAAEAASHAREEASSEAARNTLLASLSHDLRTPLAGIMGSAGALRTQGEAMSRAQRDRLLANLEDEARDMTLMADNVLQVARLAQPQSQLRLQWESAEEILGDTVARVRRRWPAARITLRVTRDLPPVRGEAGLLAQLVTNLVDNAVRHGGGHAHIAISAGRAREGIFIAVRDHGAGLPEGDCERLFERFGRQGRDGASGLGLALCRMIAQAHGGRIAARRCTPGAEFRIDLPAPST